MDRLRALFGWTTFRLCLILWCFGYLLVDLGAWIQGRSAPGFMLLMNTPLLALGLTFSLLLARLVERDRPGFVKWPLVGLSVVAAGAAQTAADHFWLAALSLAFFPQWQDWALSTDPSRLFTIYLLYTWTLFLSVALVWAARTADIARLNAARAAAFEAAASRAEAAALRLQLNPHFLFNTLNGIASLVVRNKSDDAEEMIGRLADFMRFSLAADPSALIPLRQELETIRAYLHVEEARFGERLQVAWQIDEEAAETPVQNFLLQPLIENAVKHGVEPSRRGALIEVAAKLDDGALHLSVCNRAIGKERRTRPRDGQTPAGLGIGLANTRQRLEGHYGDEAVIATREIAGGYCCDIRLPAAVSATELVAAQ